MKLKTKEEFEKDAKLIHGNLYNYSDSIYIGNKKNIVIFCNICGKYFYQRPDNHLAGAGCTNCYGNIKHTNNEFIEKCMIIHNSKYDYTKTIYNGMLKNIVVNCYLHGDFTIRAQNHLLNKQGCIKCSHTHTNTLEDIIRKGNEIYNNFYDYSLVEIIGNNRSKIEIICPIHGVFEKSISNHLNKHQGCPRCKVKYKCEELIREILITNNIKFEYQKYFSECKRIRELPFDFYLIDYDVCLEIDGIQHRKPVKRFGGEDRFIVQQEIDLIKNNFCINTSRKLIRIEYNNFSNNLRKKIIIILNKNGIKII